jgi:prepilin-type N-terminal cleavage/methylation domain-containing protein
MRAKKTGFTIVELLIVIVVIGILAAISMVAYNGVSASANDSAVQSDMAKAARKIQQYKLDNNDVYPTSAFPSTIQIRITKSAYRLGRNNFYYCASQNGDTFALSAQSVSGNNFQYSSATGSVARAASGIDGGTNCTLAGNTVPPTPSSAWFQAYNWNTTTSTGSYSAWVAN